MTVEFVRQSDAAAYNSDSCQLVTVEVAGQTFGLPILKVRDVFVLSDVTPVPLAPATITGLFNLRGRILTILSMRALLGLPAADKDIEQIAVGIEWQGEALGLLVDRVREVMTVQSEKREPNPANLDPRWAALSAGVHRLADQLLIELSLESMFTERLSKAA
jgi:purine-binding chemotaxis protein CheW